VIEQLLDRYRDRTEQAIEDSLSDIGFFMNDAILSEMRERATELGTAGKMVRGSLILLVHDMYDGDHQEEAAKAAAAIEIIHTALLAHDDVIDRDSMRRGLPALHEQYTGIADEQGLEDPDHTGTSLSICAGDIGFFLGFHLLSRLEVPAEVRERLTRLFADEFLQVGVAEAEDIVMGAATEEPTEDQILELYRTKTGRYTFSLPLIAGAILGGAPEDDIETLEKAGERLGIVYQLKDDELDLFGDQDQTGKDRGSDLAENKKTLHRLLALDTMPAEERERTRDLLQAGPDSDQIEDLIARFEDLGVRETVQDQMDELHRKASADIAGLGLPEEDRERLQALGRFCLDRDR
jgi:geranylgeranyl diphosphate synthase type I